MSFLRRSPRSGVLRLHRLCSPGVVLQSNASSSSRASSPSSRLQHTTTTSSRLHRALKQWGPHLVLSEEISHALQTGDRGIVALETAILTHGMPFPSNLTTAQSVEANIRENSSSIPATVGIVEGKIVVGLTERQLQALSDPEQREQNNKIKTIKVSRRDLAPALTFGYNGGTTVSGTMYIAHSLGIDVFVTGGIGGVHRGASESMDISADLQELGQTPMGVICAGAKSILDIGLTLELLETLGVNVTTIGETNDFPAFYSPVSGFKSPYSVSSPESAAQLLHTSLSLPRPLSTLFAIPIPESHHEAGGFIQSCVERAVEESVKNGMDKKGKEVTPWLLKRVGELSKGRALESNVKLIENNARIGGKVAEELVKERQRARARGSADAPPNGNLTRRRYYTTSTSRRQSSSSAPTPTPSLDLPDVELQKLEAPRVFSSNSTDPWFNLSYEEELFRNTPNNVPILFFYRNQPSVIIGRNQNPWKETDPEFLKENQVSLIRRRSGGGAVYHDLGNTNFSLLLPRELFNRSLGAEMVARALRNGMGIERAGVNERGDVVMFGQNGEGPLKMRSAYKIVSQRAYHHGTMLISSDLKNLGSFLRSRSPDIVTKGVESVRSPVTSLQASNPSATHEGFVKSVAASFWSLFGRLHVPSEQYPKIQEVDQKESLQSWDERSKRLSNGMKELKTWEWTYGQTPEFTQTINLSVDSTDLELKLVAKHAVILKCDIRSSDPARQPACDELAGILRQQHYDDFVGPVGRQLLATSQFQQDLVQELHRALQSKVLPSTTSGLQTTPLPSSQTNEVGPAIETEHGRDLTGSSPKVLIFGSAALDVTAKVSSAAGPTSVFQSTARGHVNLSAGGVARNIAECATRLLPPGQVLLVSPIGGSQRPPKGGSTSKLLPDDLGQTLVLRMKESGMETSGLLVRPDDVQTAGCSLVLGPDGDLIAGVADMGIVETLSTSEVERIIVDKRPEIVAFDANVTPQIMNLILGLSTSLGFKTVFEPTSIDKMERILPSFTNLVARDLGEPKILTHFTPNTFELAKICQALVIKMPHSTSPIRWKKSIGALTHIGIEDAELNNLFALTPWVENVWLKRGSNGVLHFRVLPLSELADDKNVVAVAKAKRGRPPVAAVIDHYPAFPIDIADIVSTTGAGDSFVGGLLAGLLGTTQNGYVTKNAVENAMRCAALSLRSAKAVSPEVTSLKL